MTSAGQSSASTSRVSATSPDGAHRIASVIRPGDGELVRAFGNEILFKLTTAQTAGSLTLGLAVVPPGSSPPPHIHHREDEVFIILDGRYRVLIDGTWTEDVGPGSVVYLPRGSVHTFEVVGEATGRHFVLTTPGGFERYFARCAEEVFAVPGPTDFARLAAINEEHGYAFVRPGRPAA